MIRTITIAVAIVLITAATAETVSTNKYKPVVLVHGFTGTPHDWDTFVALLAQEHPGQRAFALDVDNKWASLKPMPKQVADTLAALRSTIAANEALFADGFHLVGHSQGGLIARAVLQSAPFNVSSFVSLAGIQNGFFGDCSLWWGKNLTCNQATAVMYSSIMQATLSAANYWRTPVDHDRYLKGNTWLPVLNNEVSADPARTTNFLHAAEFHFFASPADEVIKPWCTSIFGFIAADLKTCLSIDTQPVFTANTFGLRTASLQGRLFLHQLPALKHMDWLVNKPDIIRSQIFPLLH